MSAWGLLRLLPYRDCSHLSISQWVTMQIKKLGMIRGAGQRIMYKSESLIYIHPFHLYTCKIYIYIYICIYILCFLFWRILVIAIIRKNNFTITGIQLYGVHIIICKKDCTMHEFIWKSFIQAIEIWVEQHFLICHPCISFIIFGGAQIFYME